MDPKKEAAQKALSFIQPNTIVGLGAGSSIAHMVAFLTEQKQSLPVQLVTSSFTTRQLLTKNGWSVLPISDVAAVDVYFDGCDQVDYQLNALKSGGGIHTREKLVATMAAQFILVGDDSKYVAQFDTRFPLVLEVLPEAFSYVPLQVAQLFTGVTTAYRHGDKMDGWVVTANGNYLLDTWFTAWPELSIINPTLKNITGIVETSLFYQTAHVAVLGGPDGVAIVQKEADV